MQILTTFSPTNLDNQLRAVKSWQKLGYNVASLNSESDIEKLKQVFDIEFIPTNCLGTEFGKDYVRINAFTDWIKINGYALVINSDIEIDKVVNPDTAEKTLTIFTRNDYAVNKLHAKKFDSGFDAFYISKEFAYWIPKSRLVVGQCHWDYFLPLIAIKSGFKVSSPKDSGMYHKEHKLQYNGEKWKQTGKIFALELGLTGNVGFDSTQSFKKIKREIKYYEM